MNNNFNFKEALSCFIINKSSGKSKFERSSVVACALELLARGYMPKTIYKDSLGNIIEKNDYSKDDNFNHIKELADKIEEALNVNND